MDNEGLEGKRLYYDHLHLCHQQCQEKKCRVWGLSLSSGEKRTLQLTPPGGVK